MGPILGAAFEEKFPPSAGPKRGVEGLAFIGFRGVGFVGFIGFIGL